MSNGRVARTAGLVITTSIATAAIQSTNWANEPRALVTFAAIIVGAFLAAVASDYDEGK